MAINFDLCTERGWVAQTGGIVEWSELPAFEDLRYPYLRLIDPYGDTAWSAYQCKHAVLAEIERFVIERPSPNVENLAALIRRCSDEIGTYIMFTGD